MIKLSEIKIITLTALPLMAAFLAQKGMQLIDTVMLGWIGPQALAAGALGTAMFMIGLTFCLGALSAVGIFIARARGAKQHNEISDNLQSGICLALVLALPCMIIIWYSPQLLLALGEDPRVVENTMLLLHGLVWGFPGFLLFLVFREFIASFELARVVMTVCVLSLPLTFVANYGLMYGTYGLPVLGIAGIGYAGAVIMWLMFFSLFFYSKKHPVLKIHVVAMQWCRFDAQKMRAMFIVGAPSGLLLVLDTGMFAIAAIMIGHFGVEALAAHQIAMQWVTIAYAVPVGVSMATALQVSHSAGANNMVQGKRYAYIGLSMGLLLSAVIALVFIFAPSLLANLFLEKSDPQYHKIYQYALTFLAIGAFFQSVDALQVILNGALRGIKDTFIPMLLSIVCYWGLGVSGAYYLTFYTSLAASGIWYGLTIGILSAALMLFLRFYKRMGYQT